MELRLIRVKWENLVVEKAEIVAVEMVVAAEPIGEEAKITFT